MGMKCSSCHTFAPIDSTFVLLGYTYSLVGPQIGPRSVTADPGEAQLPPLYWSVPLPARLVEAQLPPIREEAQLPPLYLEWSQPARGRPNCLSASSIPVCVPPWWQLFSLTNKNPGVHGANFKVSKEHFVTYFPIFQPHQVVVIVSVKTNTLGLSNNFVSDSKT